MRINKIIAVLSLFSFIIIYTSCNNAAGDPKEATERLIGTDKWIISEIDANDAPVFKDGKLVQQFGGPSFERYMENVRFNNDGTFTGYFKGETNPMTLNWKTNEKNITVFSAESAAAKGGEWTIDPKDVFKDSFSMKTQSTAYNYPQMTRVELKFKKVK
ncbi:hypothetical protein [Dyadobacter frigoris]|uniref:Lipocalin-like domain-containing protein n=1 Tax=Dyadobacter frigoris TaxID=2576211 RepID=A0A4U6D5W1_9BACT|nr:hypothetical protein [Dyadobacter frigoris]TKT92759.1 hypothetical protein FDK13_08115 [Dyadobacter frigoris]GLU51660.1 hypothetical protein Dfri01_11210 [Dyadobacter frigoris]